MREKMEASLAVGESGDVGKGGKNMIVDRVCNRKIFHHVVL